jgi:hypothetical protein
MKKVVSFCLWGTNPHYLDGALHALATARQFYPDWEWWFYLAEDVPATTADTLATNGATVIRLQRDGGPAAAPVKFQFQPAFWRFLPASDPDVGFLLVRDTDSPVTAREVAAVNQWLASGKELHIMRDHPKHEYPMLAGMWGCRTAGLRNMKELIAGWKRFDYYGCDQKFLGTVIYPRFRDQAWIHSECIRFPHEVIHPFPTPRNNHEFIGISFTGDTRVNKETGYLQQWIKEGKSIVSRPLPWGIKGRVRHYGLILFRELGLR